MSDGLIGFALWISYLLAIAGLLAALAFPLMHIAKNPKAHKGTFIGLGILLGIFLVSYLFSSGQANEKFDISASQSKLIGGGLISLYLIAIAAVLIAVVVEVKRMFNK